MGEYLDDARGVSIGFTSRVFVFFLSSSEHICRD